MRHEMYFRNGGLPVTITLTWLGRLRALFTGRVQFTMEALSLEADVSPMEPGESVHG